MMQRSSAPPKRGNVFHMLVPARPHHSSYTGPVTRTLATVALFLGSACSASMRPIPDDVQPVPRSSLESAKLADAGNVALADAAPRFVELPKTDRLPACADARHRTLRIRQVAPDRWIIAR